MAPKPPESYKADIEFLLAGFQPGGIIRQFKDPQTADRYRRHLYRVRQKFAGGLLPSDIFTLQIKREHSSIWVCNPYEEITPDWDKLIKEGGK